MAEAGRQLALDLPVETSHAPENFLVGPSNAAAHGSVLRWPDWPSRRFIVAGPAGSGKTHLAAIWAQLSGAARLPAAEVTPERVPTLAALPTLVLEDLDRAPLCEPALFHLLNLRREADGFLLLTSAAPPDEIGLRTPDLLSRLRTAPTLELGPPDDALLRAVLVKLFLDRQLTVEASVIEFLVTRIERSLGRAREVVAALDREALSRGRRITRPMAAGIVSDWDLYEGDDA